MAIKFLNTVQVDTDVLYVDAENDRVGIGTNSPGTKLDIVSAGLASMFRLSNTEANATNKYAAILGRHYTNTEENVTGMLITSNSNATGGSVSIGGGITAANATNNVIFYTAANNTTLLGSERMRINSSGNVGIGTTSPSAKLEITGSTATAGDTTISLKLPVGNVSAGSTEMGNILFSSADASGGGTGSIAKISTIAGDGSGAWVGSGRPTDLAFFTQPLGADAVLVEAMRIDQSGNVGIGTTDPSSLLHLESASSPVLQIKDTTNNVTFKAYAQNSNSHLGNTSNHDLFIDTNNISRIAVKAGGNVGIGETDPNALLHVRAATNVTGTIEVQGGKATVTSIGEVNAELNFGSNDVSATGGIGGSIKSITETGNGAYVGMGFYTARQGRDPVLEEAMRISNEGNVGIGTTNPKAALHIGPTSLVSGYTPDRATLAISDTTNGGQLIIRGQSPRIWFDGTAGGNAELLLDGSKLNILSGDPTSVGSSRLYIEAGGNVGIGTTTPTAPLHIEGGTNSEVLKIEADANPFVRWIDNGNNVGFLQFSSNSAYLSNMSNGSLFFRTNNTDKMTITSAGNVGIGTTSPLQRLHVQGNIEIANNSFIGSNDGNYWQRIRFEDGADATTNAFNFETRNGSGSFINHMTILNSGNVGIGTTSPEANLSVVGETSTNNLIGGSINLATSYGWTIPSGTFTQRVGYYGGDFTLNGVAAENSLELGLGPFNDRQLLWTTIGSTDNDADGGWNKTLTNLDIDSSYLSVVYFKRTTSETAGTFYHGTGNNILNLDGTANTNPYFTVRALSGFDQNVWYASVGVIQSNSDSNTVVSPLAGIYRLDTGAKINGANGFKFDTDGATLSRGHRAYLFYSIDVDVVAQFANPGFYKIDGDQPKLHDILGGDNDDVFWSVSGDNIYNDNSGNVGIGLTSPDTKLTIENASGGPASTTYATTASKANLHLSAVGVPFYNHLFMGIGSATYAWIQAQHGNSAAQNLVLNPIGGNVGIGTTSPGNKLQIATPSITSGSTYSWPFDLTRAGASSTRGFSIGVGTSGGNVALGNHNGDMSLGQTFGVDSNGLPQFYETMRISHDGTASSGNVGIGVTNPGSKLDVGGNIKVSGSISMFNGATQVLNISPSGSSAYINTGTSGGTVQFGAPASNVTNVNVQGLVTAQDINTSGGDGYLINGMGFAIESSGVLSLGDWDGNDFQTRIMDQNGVEVLRVNDEKVGIGVTSPGSKLEVYRSDSTFASTLAHMGTRSSLILRSSSTDGGQFFVAQGASGSTILQTANDTLTTPRNLNFNPFGGSVSIGLSTANPSEKLVVVGNVVATNFVLSSDKRLKENIEKVCDNIVKADWKTFELKTEKGEKRYGVIAQELEENHPEFVKTDNEGFKSVKYIDLLIAKIAELEARLEKAGI